MYPKPNLKIELYTSALLSNPAASPIGLGNFLLNKLNDKNLHEINGYYRAIKLHLRFEIVSYLKKKLKDKFILIGDDWKKYSFDALNSNYNIKENKKIYKGKTFRFNNMFRRRITLS